MLTLSHTRKTLIAILTFFVLPISGLSIDIYVPSLPAVSDYFHVQDALAQLTITTYMVGLGLTQLAAGPISDSFGRRKPFLGAMSVYIAATLLVPLSHNIHQLLVLRFIQGSTVGAMVVPMRSVILDLFKDEELAKMMNYMTIAWSIGPIIAPAIGGYLQYYFGWQACFYFLAIYSFIAVGFISLYMPETSQYRHPFNFKSTLERYSTIIRHTAFIAGLISNSALYSLIILFSVLGPFLLQDVMHYTPVQFGHISLMMGTCWFLGNLTNRFLIGLEINKKIKICLSLMLLIVIAMLVSAIELPLNIYNVVIPTGLLLYFGGLIFPNYFATVLPLFPQITGSTNALFGALIFFISGLAGGAGTLLKATSEMPLAFAYLCLILLCIVIALVHVHPNHSYKKQEQLPTH